MPPTPLDLYTLTFEFELNRVGTNEDIALFDLSMRGVGGAEYGDSQLASAAQGGINAWVATQAPAWFSTNVHFGWVTATNYLANGHINHQQRIAVGTAWDGTDSGPALPWETTLCTSLYTYPRGTFVSNGRRKRGRYYLPPMAASRLDSSNSGYFKNSDVAAALSRQHDFCQQAQQDMVGVDVGVLVVYSRTDGVTRDVVELSLDAKFDSQRRRENREVAGYDTVAFP
jgi:hypothetical protein